MDTQMPDGADLRTTRLNRNGILIAISVAGLVGNADIRSALYGGDAATT
jgi:hypothetical protein